MIRKVRILPLTILIVGLSLGVQIGDLWPTSSEDATQISISQAYAQEADGEEAAAEDSAFSEESAFQEDQADGATEDAPKTNQFGEETQQFTRGEINMLQNLVSRREQLAERERQLELRENLIQVAEQRVEEKINELKIVEARIQSLLDQHDEQQEEKLQSLVKMYQTMKPADAARIFETLDMEILIEVVERMSERRMAPIMAAMQSERAKAVTVELATRKKLPERGG